MKKIGNINHLNKFFLIIKNLTKLIKIHLNFLIIFQYVIDIHINIKRVMTEVMTSSI